MEEAHLWLAPWLAFSVGSGHPLSFAEARIRMTEPIDGSSRFVSARAPSLPCRRSWVRVPLSALKIPAKWRLLSSER